MITPPPHRPIAVDEEGGMTANAWVAWCELLRNETEPPHIAPECVEHVNEYFVESMFGWRSYEGCINTNDSITARESS